MWPVPAHEVQRGWTAQEQVADAPYLTFVQFAQGCVFTASTLELVDLAPVTVSLGPGPAYTLGHMTTSAFLDLWWAVDDSSPGEPQRHGVVSVLDPERRPLSDTRVLLTRPRIYGSGLRYDLAMLAGVPPELAGSCAVFIEPARTRLPAPTEGT